MSSHSPPTHFLDTGLKNVSSYVQVSNVVNAYVVVCILTDDGSLFLWFGSIWSLVLF
jgi:hypothetical protein